MRREKSEVGSGTELEKSPLLAPKTREKWGTQLYDLLERLDCCGFVVFHVEDSVEFGDLQQIVDFLGKV